MDRSNGNSNAITRDYLDSLLVETRYMDSTNPCLDLSLFGESFSTPVMTAALSHLDHFMEPGATMAYAQGAADAGAILWIGMAPEEEVEACASTGARVVEIIKPYSDRDIIYQKIEHAQRIGLLAVGIDIDHPFGEDGSPDMVDGYEMTAMTTEELKKICDFSSLPVIAKGVLSLHDADCALRAGVQGMVLSHHNNRINYALPALALLPEVKDLVGDTAAIFVDGEIRTGMDVFKALALGATAVGIGRPLMTAIKEDGAQGVCAYLQKVNGELKKAMACTGCTALSKMDRTVIHRI